MSGRIGLRRIVPAAFLALPAAAAMDTDAAVAQDRGRSVGEDGSSAAYVVECPETETSEAGCAADVSTYVGWRVFEQYCASCHGNDAEGSSFAPSLVHRLQRFDRRAFVRALDEGYAVPVMRPWGEHPQVARYYDELWAYLSARANGDLPAGSLRPLRDVRAR